ncbi:MAG: Sec-dependent nitrous-oxide reductase [Actinomycetota bacterium]|nr:Sec-dependent nitrous-oxide reductase [Actinomycetota bacterium]MDH5223821.1 Sec-dependent nitrous-oxide reductase [Actinomycetota bacterium]MDH5313392.1 Sec-dependent nitrous-oxide reductase [Actinomycetota bacterium]
MGEDGERFDSTDEQTELPPPGERPIRRRGPTVSRRAALGMMVGGAAVGVVGARVGFGSSSGGDLSGIAGDRGLDGAQAEAALKTYVPGGVFDEYFIISSGGHSGNLYVIGVPSMRMLKEIPVFTPNAWQGYGYGTDQGDKVLTEGADAAKSERLRWGDTHHPAISETDGMYDGRFVYINDRANGRIGMVDLRDFKTKQILDIPNLQTSHGGCFVTPNSEYVHISSMTPCPVTESGYAPLSRYKEDFRGFSTWLRIDQETGRFVMDESFQIELPPYTQDLADAGKLASFGLGFINTYNTEMATGGNLHDGHSDPAASLESSATKNDYDLLNIIDWQQAEAFVKAGTGLKTLNGMTVIPLEAAASEGILHFAPEPRNPHGVDVSPTGDYIVVSGKLDPNGNVYSTERIKEAIANQDYEGTDPFGVPILTLDSVLEAQVELGAGPLHSQFDDQGYAYTSLFIDTAVAKWSLGPKAGHEGDDAFKLVETLPVQYNIGHLVTAEGDTVQPAGKYLVALNKWSIDRFAPVGTLHPQNFQLVDLSGEKMTVLLDMPIGMGEPHYVQMIHRDKLTGVIQTYEPGTDPLTWSKSDFAIVAGEERVERKGTDLHVYMSALRSHFTPDVIEAKQGDTLRLHLTNVEQTPDATHGFAIPAYNIEASIDPGEVVNIDLPLTRPGTFAMYCSEFCSALHLEMQGWLEVAP